MTVTFSAGSRNRYNLFLNYSGICHEIPKTQRFTKISYEQKKLHCIEDEDLSTRSFVKILFCVP